MMFVVLILIIGFVFADDKCKFKLSSGEKIHLESVPTLEVDLSDCGEEYHTLTFELCKDLNASQCNSTYTDGPGSACDVYHGKSKSFWWIGGIDIQWVKSPYDQSTQTWLMTYSGKPQTKEEPHWTRNMRIKMICNKKVTKAPVVKCQGIQQSTSTTTYIVSVEHKVACPWHWW